MKNALYALLLFAAAFHKNAAGQEASVFPKGDVATVNNHTGTVWLNELAGPDSVFNYSIAVATFAPGAKLDWHLHPAGQHLLVTEGVGYYQERGKPIQVVSKGDVIKCLPGVEHWHGAAPQSSFAYVGVTPAQKGKTVWLKRVTPEEYNSATPSAANTLNTQQPMPTSNRLDKKQQSIVLISAFTAKGDLVPLQNALNAGLDAGLPINEIKEVLLQLYAYAGFPRSLNALNTLMAVLKTRSEKGITDVAGKEPGAAPEGKTKRQLGTEIQTKLVGTPVTGAVYEFAPAVDQFLKEHLFADVFGRDNLDWKTRELATIAALAALGGVEAQLRSHFGVGMYNGLTAEQLTELTVIVQASVSKKEGMAAKEVLQTVLKQRAAKDSNK